MVSTYFEAIMDAVLLQLEVGGAYHCGAGFGPPDGIDAAGFVGIFARIIRGPDYPSILNELGDATGCRRQYDMVPLQHGNFFNNSSE